MVLGAISSGNWYSTVARKNPAPDNRLVRQLTLAKPGALAMLGNVTLDRESLYRNTT